MVYCNKYFTGILAFGLFGGDWREEVMLDAPLLLDMTEKHLGNDDTFRVVIRACISTGKSRVAG